MDATVVTSTLVAAAGLALVLQALAQLVFKMRINVPAGTEQLVKLCEAGNLDRVARLVKVPDVPTYFAAVDAALDAGRAGAPTGPAFDKAAAQVDLRWRTLAERGQVGAAVAIAALVLQVAMAERTQAVMTMVGLAVIGAIWHTVHKQDMATALAAVRASVLPALDRALATRDNKVS